MRILLAAMAALGACTGAHAGAWNFEFAGLVGQQSFYRQAGEIFSVVGSFTGDDANHDGLISAGEVGFATLQGRQVLPSPGSFEDPTGSLVPQGRFGAFAFAPASLALTRFDAGHLDSFHGNSISLSWDAPGGAYSEGGGSDFWTYSLSAPGVTLRVTPVPEPATWLLLAAGLVVLAAAGRRRRG